MDDWKTKDEIQRRTKVDLGPIQEYVGRWGVEWTIEQKEK